MFAGRSDLPLDKDALSRFLPWLIAFMVFLAVLAMAGMMVLKGTADRWDRGISGTLTVQLIPTDDPKADDERLQALLAQLARTPEVARYEALDDNRLLDLLEPWLGAGSEIQDLPLPRLIDVELRPGAALSTDAFAHALASKVPGVSIDDHRVWLDRLIRLIQSVQGLAAMVLFFIAMATVGTVVFTTRTGLAIHRDAIEVLHLIGAQDSYVAGQFASRAMSLGLKGGVIGLALALPTLLGIRALAREMDATLLPDVTLGAVHWAVLAGLPLVVALIAMTTARTTVMKTLARML